MLFKEEREIYINFNFLLFLFINSIFEIKNNYTNIVFFNFCGINFTTINLVIVAKRRIF